MRAPGSLLLMILVCALAANAQALPGRIDAAIHSTPAAQRAHWGVAVVDLTSGETLVGKNPEALFTPASNTKLFSTAVALMRLGADYRFITTVRAATGPHASGILPGSLVLVGGGDPTLSGRLYPYRKGQEAADPWEAMERLAEEVAKKGIRQIDGDIVGDDTRYPWAPRGASWTTDDGKWAYGAPVSALSFADNAVALFITPGRRAGALPKLEIRPEVEYFHLDNRLRTVETGESNYRVVREAGSRQVVLEGDVLLRGRTIREGLGVDDPAEFAAQALYDALRRLGIAIRGKPVARHRAPGAPPAAGAATPTETLPVELARRESPPLSEILRLINKVSQNLHAELILREAGYAQRGVGTVEAGLEELRTLMDEAGVAERLYGLEDGSGLGRGNQLSPAAVTGLLRHMYASSHRDLWISLLPVGAADGTLEYRFGGAPAAHRIRAKTGTLARASALSGYALREDGRVLAFSILVNGYLPREGSAIRQVVDKIALALLE